MQLLGQRLDRARYLGDFGGAILAVAFATVASAQTFKMTTPFAPGVAVPDKVESSIGTLNLDYGYPSAETVDKIYDNLDRYRAWWCWCHGHLIGPVALFSS